GTKKETETFVRVTSLTFRRESAAPGAPTSPGPATSGRPVDGEGVITTVNNGSACPTAAFYIGPYLINVTPGTVFDRGTCSDLAAGVRVHVTGAMSDTNIVTASQISVQSAPQRPPVAGEGRVTS